MPSLPLPKSMSEKRSGPNRSTFIIEPLYPGYGMTVGNALRRVLLSSLSGAAITAVTVKGADHEFSSLPNVKEDVVDIILNLKQIRFRVHGEGPWVATLSVKGSKSVTAADITSDSAVEVINTDQPICTVTDKAGAVEMEFHIGLGRGYVPVENREMEKLPIGTIAIDAIYTPVKNVNFATEHVRVEQMTNFDKLTIDVTTDGTMTPADALRQAAHILVEHYQFIDAVPSADESAAAAPAEEASATESPEVPAEEKPKKKTVRKKKADETE
jgi:DNA-directed RNA polymerase subunit alpha